jgi:predicted Zn-dependent protease
MRVAGRAWVVIAVGLTLHGCGGTIFELPPVTGGEALRAAQEVDSDPALPLFHRSDAAYVAMVDRLGVRLVRNVGPLCQFAETNACRFRFTYVADDEVNAFTAEGGRIYLHRGLLDYLETEEEIAAVMAHEMGHGIGNHVEEDTGSVILGALLGALVMGAAATAGDADADAADQMTATGMVLGAAIGRLTFSKEQEREADLLGAYVLARAGMDLDRAGALYAVLSKLDEDVEAGWNDSHPAGPQRVVAWRKAVADVEANGDLLPHKLP